MIFNHASAFESEAQLAKQSFARNKAAALARFRTLLGRSLLVAACCALYGFWLLKSGVWLWVPLLAACAPLAAAALALASPAPWRALDSAVEVKLMDKLRSKINRRAEAEMLVENLFAAWAKAVDEFDRAVEDRETHRAAANRAKAKYYIALDEMRALDEPAR